MSTSNSHAESPSTATPTLSAPDGSQGRNMMTRNASNEGLHRSQTTTNGSRSIALGEERLIERRRAATLSEAPDRKRRFRLPEHGSDGDRDGSSQMSGGDGTVFEQGSSSRMPVRSVSGVGSSSAVPIDLTSSSPPALPTPAPRQQQQPPAPPGQGRLPGTTDYMEYIRPRWQPDEEVSECPICEVPFSFWYRKHHCRKCGRVVCASCSPHRITIPRQYIVRPPDADGGMSAVGAAGAASAAGFVSVQASQAIDSERNESPLSPSATNPALGGGEEVRLCNPCVPDPNPEPPRVFVQPNPPRHRSHHSMSVPRTLYGPGEGPRPGRRTVGSNDYPCFGFGNLFGGSGSYQDHSSSMRFASDTHHRPLPPDPSTRPARPRRVVNERDICPICNCRFPPLPENGDESGREAHVRSCIDNHGARARSSSQPHPPAPAPAQSHLQIDTQAAGAGGPSQQAAGAATAATPVFPVRMVAFTATEKDCLGHDEGAQECTICMEEYEVGQPLVRLECLCKFHKRCIVEWFERKRECPVHKS